MRLLFLCGWKLNDVLAVSTVLPYLEMLVRQPNVNNIVLLTVEGDRPERTNTTTLDHPLLKGPKIKWVPLYFRKLTPFKLINQVVQSCFIKNRVIEIVKEQQVQLIISYGAPVGSLAYQVWQETAVPFWVSSFEPHASYMLESDVWSRYGLKFNFQKYWENRQLKSAVALMPVTQSFTEKLINEGVPAQNLRTVPCYVNAVTFKFDNEQRVRIRTELNWQKNIIGVYVGKYGDLYYKEEAFKIYEQCFSLVPDFRLIILSPQSENSVLELALKYKLDPKKIHITTVPHELVSHYLSASDFAFATIKSYPSAKYCSPVKIGEYWANGLPVLLTEAVGDDSDIINNEGGGALFNLEQEGSVEQAIRQILTILKDPQHRQEIPKLAHKYRSPDRLREAFEYFFRKGEQESSI